MTTSQSTIDFLLDQLSGCGPITARKMFGEYAVYLDDKVLGFVCDDIFYLKLTPTSRALLPDGEEGAAYPSRASTDAPAD